MASIFKYLRQWQLFCRVNAMSCRPKNWKLAMKSNNKWKTRIFFIQKYLLKNNIVFHFHSFQAQKNYFLCTLVRIKDEYFTISIKMELYRDREMSFLEARTLLQIKWLLFKWKKVSVSLFLDKFLHYFVTLWRLDVIPGFISRLILMVKLSHIFK